MPFLRQNTETVVIFFHLYDLAMTTQIILKRCVQQETSA